MKKSNKKQSLLSRINFRTRKAKIITVTVIFALVGAAFVFRSFALDTPVKLTRQWFYSVGSGNLDAIDRSKACEPNQNIRLGSVASESTGKGTYQVIEARCFTNNNSIGEGAATRGAYLDGTSSGRKIRACFWARAVTAPVNQTSGVGFLFANIELRHAGVTLDYLRIQVNKTSNFNEYCTFWVDSRGAGPVEMRIEQAEPGVMRIQQIFLFEGIKQESPQPTPAKNPQPTPPAPPAPAPAPTK